MNTKKIGFFALAAGMVILIIGLLFLVNKEDKPASLPTVQTEKEEPPNAFEEEVESHTDYVQDIDEDPFNEITEETGKLTIGNLPLSFTYLNGTSYENTGASLIDASENHLLYHSYNDVLTFYDGIEKKRYTLDKFFNKALITPDEQYIIYTKNAFNKEAFYYLDLKSLEQREFDIYQHDSRMKIIDMRYHDGLIYFIVQEADTNKTSVHFTALPSTLDDYTAVQRNSVIDINTNELYQFEHGIYAFNKQTSAVEQIIPANPTVPLIKIDSHKVKTIRSVDFYDKKTWVVSIQNDKDEFVLLTPTQTITTYEGLMSAHWFDEKHLVVNDNLSLYLYNLETNENHVAKAGISYVFPTRNDLTIQTNDGSLLKLKKQ